MGWRYYGNEDLSEKNINWEKIRIENLVPEFGKELSNDSYILEHGFEKLNGVDFKKGCYIGQENTARMKLKNKLGKTLLPVSFEKNIPALSEITYKQKVVGKILIPEPYPFGLFKTNDPSINELIKGDLLSENIKLKIINVLYT